MDSRTVAREYKLKSNVYCIKNNLKKEKVGNRCVADDPKKLHSIEISIADISVGLYSATVGQSNGQTICSRFGYLNCC